MIELLKFNTVVTIVISFVLITCGAAFAGKGGSGGPKSNTSSSNEKLQTTYKRQKASTDSSKVKAKSNILIIQNRNETLKN